MPTNDEAERLPPDYDDFLASIEGTCTEAVLGVKDALLKLSVAISQDHEFLQIFNLPTKYESPYVRYYNQMMEKMRLDDEHL